LGPVKEASYMPEMVVPIPQTVDAPRTARSAVSTFLAEQGLDAGWIADVLLVVSELVTNAMLHGRPPIELCVASDCGACRVAVRDGDPDHGPAALPERFATAGRGLGIVAAVTDDSGVDRDAHGKTVWASWHLPGP
jgi:anti-sigma regulatory factor (Ser/Thr protein kinase)